MVMVAQVYEYTKNHFKRVNFMICEWYFNSLFYYYYFDSGEREYECNKSGGASCPTSCHLSPLHWVFIFSVLLVVLPRWDKHPTHYPSIVQISAGPSCQATALLSPMDSRVLRNQGKHGNILRTFPGHTSGNIHSSGREDGCFYPSPGWGRI